MMLAEQTHAIDGMHRFAAFCFYCVL